MLLLGILSFLQLAITLPLQLNNLEWIGSDVMALTSVMGDGDGIFNLVGFYRVEVEGWSVVSRVSPF
jgi:hypothetical protein